MTFPHARLPPGSLPAGALLLAAFAWPLLHLARFSAASELYSYILLIPLVSAYLATLPRPAPAGPPGKTLPWLAAFLLLLSLAAAVSASLIRWPETAVLSWQSLAFVLAAAAWGAFFLDRATLRERAFPLAFLLFMIPLPPAVERAVEAFLQYGSVAAANALFTLTGVPVLQDGLTFQLPGGVKFNVEPVCSGLHSTIVLLLTALVAGHLFLRTRWKQLLLLACVVPLALLRNGFRIYVIGQLAAHYGVAMFQSWIHLHGGPVFFALALIPFFTLLFWLARTEPSAPAV